MLPVLIGLWKLAPAQIGTLIAIGYLGQVIGSIFFGWLAEKIGRVPCTIYTLVLFSVMSFVAAFAWDYQSLAAIRFVQGIGLGGEIPIMATYIGEFANSARRGRFALGYQLLFTFGLLFTGLAGVWVVPTFGWQWMFIIGALPALIAIPLRWLLPESPRWLASRGRIPGSRRGPEQDRSGNFRKRRASVAADTDKCAGGRAFGHQVSALLQGQYLRRSLTVWAIWFCSYSVVYGLSTWMPSIFRTVYQVSVQQSVNIGFMLSAVGVVGALIAVSSHRFRRAQTLVCGRAIAERGTLLILAFTRTWGSNGAAAGDGRVLLYHLARDFAQHLHRRALPDRNARPRLRCRQCMAALCFGHRPLYGRGNPADGWNFRRLHDVRRFRAAGRHHHTAVCG